MSHPNEDTLRRGYGAFAHGDLEGFLAICTDDVTFTVPGTSPVSGVYNRHAFIPWITRVISLTDGTFREDVIDVFANDNHAVLLLRHTFERDGRFREYRTAHICEMRNGLIAKWTEHPGSLMEFDAAWSVDYRRA